MKLEEKDELYRIVYRANMLKSGEAAAAAANAVVKIVSEAEVKHLSEVEEIPSNTYLRILTVEEVREIVVESLEEIAQTANQR